MFTIQTLNKISAIGTDRFDEKYTVADQAENPDAIMVRSAAMHDMEFGENLLAIARAGAGVNNIPVQRCAEEGICVFNTPGANANAVKELVLTGLLMSSRDVFGGMKWAATLEDGETSVAKQVEKGKSQFVGPEISGKTLGIIGLGAIGALVANAAISLGMKVVGTDPFLSVGAALRLKPAVTVVKSNDEVFAECDYLTLHVPYNKDTAGMINAETIAKMKDGVRVLNYARGELVNDDDMLAALESGKVACYCTDFPNAKTTNVKGIIATPHLGASTPESEDNCAIMAADELIEYLETGNIRNSVNLPNAEMTAVGTKVCVIHKNVPAMIAAVTTAAASCGLNIENMVNASRGDFAYTMLDLAGNVSDNMVDTLSRIEGIIRVRVIK
ncbi:MAG: phosphoglycerate dehydrogenase [Ruminococcus sp.]|nr:phosphoglycerate dehydrogenase [Ruminococcus sp.]